MLSTPQIIRKAPIVHSEGLVRQNGFNPFDEELRTKPTFHDNPFMDHFLTEQNAINKKSASLEVSPATQGKRPPSIAKLIQSGQSKQLIIENSAKVIKH